MMDAMGGRFVIQEHTTEAGSHYDVMLEAGQALATWRLETLPGDLAAGEAAAAEALPDHRRAYLSYEGEISGGRGRVRIADRGEYRLHARDEDRWAFDLAGELATGRFELTRLAGPHWELRAV